MSRYPEAARHASIKCIGCNAPVVRTIDDTFVCVECGESPISSRDNGDGRSVDGNDYTVDAQSSESPAA